VTGLVIGTAAYGLSRAFEMDPNDDIWRNFTSSYLPSASGDAANIVDTNSFRSGGCGTVHNNLGVSWMDGFRSATSAPGYLTFDAFAAANIRCDAQANTGLSPGCAITNCPPQLTYNQATGGSCSSFIQNNRLLDGDPFWIGIE